MCLPVPSLSVPLNHHLPGGRCSGRQRQVAGEPGHGQAMGRWGKVGEGRNDPD